MGAVRINAVPQPGQWIRRAGEDITAAQWCAAKRHAPDACRAGPGGQHRAGAAAGGAPPARGAVFHRRRTGHARRGAARAHAAGAIYNSNRFFLRATAAAPGLRGDRPGHRARPARRHRGRAARGRSGHDLILTSGGVSVGEEDHIKPAVQALGSAGPVADRHQARQAVCLRPGRVGQAHFIGLPGNPVSSFRHLCCWCGPSCCAAGGARCDAPSNHSCPRRFHLAQGRQAPRIPARAPQRRRRAGPVPTRARACSPRPSGATGWWTTRPARPLQPVTRCASLPLGALRSCCHEASRCAISPPSARRGSLLVGGRHGQQGVPQRPSRMRCSDSSCRYTSRLV
jgi:hypothetical protein